MRLLTHTVREADVADRAGRLGPITIRRGVRIPNTRTMLVLLVAVLALLAVSGCYDSNTGATNIGDSVRFTLPAFPETGANKIQIFTEMHYQPSYRSQESPRLDVPDSAVPITGKEVVLTSVDEYAALRNPGGDASRGAQLFTVNCVVCHGTELDGLGPVMVTGPSMVPANLRGEITVERTDGELFGLISFGGNTGFTTRVPALTDPTVDGERCVGQGSCPMPEFRKLLTESERWDLVAYLRNMQGQ